MGSKIIFVIVEFGVKRDIGGLVHVHDAIVVPLHSITITEIIVGSEQWDAAQTWFLPGTVFSLQDYTFTSSVPPPA